MLERYARLLGPAHLQGKLFLPVMVSCSRECLDPSKRIRGEIRHYLRQKTCYAGWICMSHSDSHPERSAFVRMLRPISFEETQPDGMNLSVRWKDPVVMTSLRGEAQSVSYLAT
ncbi:MAG: hypothetical protein D6703_04595 [Zetaproteobacteria bacterium]|nr:MAG: hypothetical protein D6703_04595 [Zetaproteobacteria bacterium]